MKIESLHIEKFRSLKDVQIKSLGRVNLITGRNNTGKSSVLEALRLLTADSLANVITSILRFRGEDAMEEETITHGTSTDRYYSMSSLFYNYPDFSENVPPLQITSTGDDRDMELSIAPVWLSEETNENGIYRLVPVQPSLLIEESTDLIPGLNIQAGGRSRSLPLNYFRHGAGRIARSRTSALRGNSQTPCIFVDPYAGEKTAAFGNLWDAIALSPLEHDVVEALKIVEPTISAISMVGGESPMERKAIVKTHNRDRPVSLRSFGDGLNHLFGIILSLVNARDGLLLVDEFENGLHHSVQVDTWHTVFRLARRLDIQVVATTHSWDCIKAFQVAAAEDPEEGVLVRLTRKGDDVIPTIFREEELEIVTSENIEVR